MTRRPTLKDVAARAAVSYQTVSKVINGTSRVPPTTEERIWTAVRDLNYVPSEQGRNLRTRRSGMIGYSWRSTDPAITPSPVMDEFLTAMVGEAEAAGYYLLPFSRDTVDGQVNDYRRLISSGRVDGFVLSSLDYDDPRLSYLLAEGFPFVAFGRSDPFVDFPFVDIDGGAGLLQVVDHLVSRGHRRIALAGLPEASRVGDDRLQGYLDGLRRHGLPIDLRLVVRGEDSVEGGRRAMSGWLGTGGTADRPTAVAAMSDTIAIGVMEVVRARGLVVGSEIAVTGFDDAPMSRYLEPKLTTVRQPLREAGHQAIQAIARLIEGQPLDARHVLLVPKLIVRESS